MNLVIVSSLFMIFTVLMPQVFADAAGEDFNPPNPIGKISLVSRSKAQEIYNAMAGDKEIDFSDYNKGCEIRAHQMAQKMEKLGVISGKVFAMPNNRERTGFNNVNWNYHTAPFIMVKSRSEPQIMVIDPSLDFSTGPLFLGKWVDGITDPGGPTPVLVFRSRFWMYANEFEVGSINHYENISSWRSADDAEIARYRSLRAK